MFSGVVPWLINVLAGVEVADDAIGGDRLVVAPLPPSGARLQWAAGALRTPLGRAACSWSCDGKGSMHTNVTVPVDTTAQVVLPSSSAAGGWLRKTVGSGNWTFSTNTALCTAA